MIRLWKRALICLLLALAFYTPARAHTPDISTGKIASQANHLYVVDIGFLATDLEKIFQATMAERIGADLSAPGVLETEIGKLISKRIRMHGENNRDYFRRAS